jgi:glucose-1-phosphate adenylyltransferase
MPARILLVDDSQHFLESAQRFLAEELGIEIVGTALSGAQAIEKSAQLHPDLILMDVAMPEIDGLEATSHIKAQPHAPRIIILTLYDTPKYREAAHNAGADGFIPKADFGEKLLPLIHSLLPGLTEPQPRAAPPSNRLHTRPLQEPAPPSVPQHKTLWMPPKVRAVILAGGEGSRLGVLTARRAKPAVPFAGKYRIIDFTLSNCVNSGLFDILLITQYLPHSLNEHIGVGRAWDLDRSFTGGLRLLQPYKDRIQTDWYNGTADAVLQNMAFIKEKYPDLILILAGDHVYQMNYAPMLAFHAERNADLTIATLRVPTDQVSRFGILTVNEEQRAVQFVEKPEHSDSNLASMGIYIFKRELLEECLLADHKNSHSSHDFGKDIIPHLVASGARVFAYPHSGYWMDVGTLEGYWGAHMDLLKENPNLNLNDRSWIIHTRAEERPPMLIQRGASAQDSLISTGVVIAPGARIERSVIGPGVSIGQNAVIRESIIFSDSVIEAHARVERAIIDKNVIVGINAHIGALSESDDENGITVIGKNVQIASGLRVGRGMSISPDVYLDPEPPLWSGM